MEKIWQNSGNIICNLAEFRKSFGRVHRAQSGHPARANLRCSVDRGR